MARGGHSIWPWIDYHAITLGEAQEDFEQRVPSRRNLESQFKKERVRQHVLHHAPTVFRMRDIRAALPGTSDQTIRLVVRCMRTNSLIAPVDESAGPESAWTRTDAAG